MDSGVDRVWVEAIRAWAASEPLVEAAYVFGSRVKGTHQTESDLDLAVIVAGADDGERLGYAIVQMQRWTDKLNAELPVLVHLQCATAEDMIVMPAVREHGYLVYSAEAQAAFPERRLLSGA